MRQAKQSRKEMARSFKQVLNFDVPIERLKNIANCGKVALDTLMNEMGKMMVESLLFIEREELLGPDQFPTNPGNYKWGKQPGSVFLGDRKLKIDRFRARNEAGEIPSTLYNRISHRGQFSEEMFGRMMAGISTGKYQETLTGLGDKFGVARSSLSRDFIAASAAKLKEFKERNLSNFKPFAVFLDGIRQGDSLFVVAVGIDITGEKMALGYWQGSTENHIICNELLENLCSRGLALNNEIIFITDGGKGIIKALRERYGKSLIHQRCIIHKNNNIQMHLAKKYRKRAQLDFYKAFTHENLADVKADLLALEKWLRHYNASAAESLLEALPELLTLHRLKVPAELRKTLKSTNCIESTFAVARHSGKNLRNQSPMYKGKPVKKKLSERWMAATLLEAEKGYRRVKGYKEIRQVKETIKKLNESVVPINAKSSIDIKTKKAA